MVNKYYSIKYPTRSRLKDPWKNSSSNSSPKRRTDNARSIAKQIFKYFKYYKFNNNNNNNSLRGVNWKIVSSLYWKKKLSKKSWWMLVHRHRVIQIPPPPLRRVIFLPGIIINTRFKILRVALSRFKTGSSRFEHGTRPARPSGIINSKPDIRTHILRSVFRRSIAALSRYIFLFSIL